MRVFCYNKYGDTMNIIEIITKKKNKEELTFAEIEYAVNGYVAGTIPDYQMSSLLMAIVIQGMSEQEIVDLTKVMISSGDVVTMDAIEGVVVDKHSTGGVGDKTTLVVAPLVASCGVKVAKMSGRGLGHTGGTIDKLESIAGYRTELSKEEFFNQVNEIGLAVASQSGNLVPADKKIYALRDVTGTTESIPLIASSIMSKKIASGAKYIVIDVKVGNGALMKNEEDAKCLARTMIRLGEAYGRKVTCILSNMSEPLGYAIGNGLEVEEATACLQNNGPKDVMELCLELASEMVALGKQISKEKAKDEVQTVLENGEAYQTFKRYIKAQGGDLSNITKSAKCISIKSKQTGFIEAIDTESLGELAKELGAGRETKEDKISYGVGFVLNKKVGDYVLENEELLKVYMEDKDIKIDKLLDCFTIGMHAREVELIIDVIDSVK